MMFTLCLSDSFNDDGSIVIKLPYTLYFSSGWTCKLEGTHCEFEWINVINGDFEWFSTSTKKWVKSSLTTGIYKDARSLASSIIDKIFKSERKHFHLEVVGETLIMIFDSKLRFGEDLSRLLGAREGVTIETSEYTVCQFTPNWNCPEIMVQAPGLVEQSVINGITSPLILFIPQPNQGIQQRSFGLAISRNVMAGSLERIEIKLQTPLSAPLQSFMKKRIVLLVSFTQLV